MKKSSFGYFCFNIAIICITPNKPKTGYVKFTKPAKLSEYTKIAKKQIIFASSLYVFSDLQQFARKLYPAEIIVVYIAKTITIP